MSAKRLIFGRCLFIALCALSSGSCGKFAGDFSPVTSGMPLDKAPLAKAPLDKAPLARAPLAVLKTGAQPIWFQFTEAGPVHIESIEDAAYSAAFIPWPLALHIRFFQEKGGELIMAVNRDGFLKLAPDSVETDRLALYRFGGGEFWKKYTIGSFLFYDEKPVVLLYLDDRFLDSDAPVPNPRTWTFNMESNIPFPLGIPALDIFPANDGWNVNTLRLGIDGFWYFRVINKTGAEPDMRMLRAVGLSSAGAATSLEDFQNSTPYKTEIDNPLLPPLPQGYVYTGEAVIGGNIFACWEEQKDYNIGAAGFMVMKLNPRGS